MSETPTGRGHGPNGQTPPNAEAATKDDSGLPPVEPIETDVDPVDDVDRLIVKEEESVFKGTRRMMVTIAVRKPSKDEFFRSHPTAEYGPLVLFEHKSGTTTEHYAVVKEIWDEERDLLRAHVRRVVLRATINKQGALFLHPVPCASSKSNAYNDTRREAAIIAVNEWVRLEADTDAGQYDVYVGGGNLAPPKWPEFDIKELVRKAFKDRYITSKDHDFLRYLRSGQE